MTFVFPGARGPVHTGLSQNFANSQGRVCVSAERVSVNG